MRLTGKQIAFVTLVGATFARVTLAQDGERVVQIEKPKAPAASSVFLDLLWLTQHVGAVEAVEPRHDARTKAVIGKILSTGRVLSAQQTAELMDAATFAQLAGADGRLAAAEIQQALAAQMPASRKRLLPKVEEHLNLLTTGYDMLDESQGAAGRKLVDWIVENYRPGQPLAITCVCTGNSRRSILAATMVNVSAAYYGLPEIRGFSGGTKPSAFNERTVTALREIGIEVTKLGEEAARGDAATANPKHRIRWGSGPEDSSMRTIEFSKKYDDAANPSSGFAALIVCSDAEEDCPLIKGASTRIGMPYLDPKAYDGSAIEARKYAERRDDIGRLMLAVMMQSRLRLIAAGKFATTIDSK
ncbi:MAG: hypothetical protein AABP62_19675 [Planctomycetota bacterium]